MNQTERQTLLEIKKHAGALLPLLLQAAYPMDRDTDIPRPVQQACRAALTQVKQLDDILALLEG